MSPARGLLIVNADDWGGFREGTDAIERCFAAGAISSTTAMVHMADSARAAELARERARPTGLHLNLTQPFDAPDVPEAVRERQRRLCAHFRRLGARRWTRSPDPRVHRLLADAIAEQLEAHRALYARDPTHLDSHHHVHLCPDVYRSRAFPRELPVRQTLSFAPARSRAPGGVPPRARLTHLLGTLKHALLARRFHTTESFWCASELSPGSRSLPIADIAAHAAQHTVEVMVHPSFEAELDVLLAEPWLAALRGASLGSYGDFAALSR
ncbi:MAG TPA: ChbG/HpnK family deacetylase [Solirubrobacteraceae bacterium]|nr:ChbG/HpnK family deacetylase [Solirubrobacteraceae bacterium]